MYSTDKQLCTLYRTSYCTFVTLRTDVFKRCTDVFDPFSVEFLGSLGTRENADDVTRSAVIWGSKDFL
jgi:hypothetical protein